MKLRNPRLIKMAGWFGGKMIRLYMRTVRCHTDSQGQRTNPWDPSVREKFIYVLWHENMLFVPAVPVHPVAPMTVLISQHSDGEWAAQVCHANGFNTVRGSSTRGGTEAIDEIIKLRETSHVLMAPDGPRGPRRQVKRGLVYLASWTQMPIVPLGIGFERAWRINSWDRTAIPRMGSKATCVAGPVIRVPYRAGKAALNHYHQIVQQAMDEASRVAEAWAQGKPVPPRWPIPTERAA